jgi:hypothetical protein
VNSGALPDIVAPGARGFSRAFCMCIAKSSTSNRPGVLECWNIGVLVCGRSLFAIPACLL